MSKREKEVTEMMKPGDGFVQSFARGLAVIGTFSEERSEQTLSQVAKEAGITRAGARRILLTLVNLGYAEVNGSAFRLTPKILDLGFAYLSSMPFWNLGQPVLEHLVEQVKESSSIAVLDDDDVVYVLRVPTRKIMTVSLSIGSRLPALWTSLGRVILADKTDDEIREYIKLSDLSAKTSTTITEPEVLLKELQRIRKKGWAIVDQELEDGLISIAAPIKDRQGRVIAAINISGNAQRNTAEQIQETFLEPLLKASNLISNLIKKR